MSKAVLVGTGSFRVDRKRALDKLMQFQLADAAMFLLPWVQAGVAGGAKRIAVATGSGGLTMSFDGAPWTAAELKDPYGCLFDREAGWRGARGRGLAIGLLSCLRLSPRGIAVRGKDGALLVESVTSERLDGEGTSAGGLAIVVDGVGTGKALDHLRERCRWCTVPIEIDGQELERGAPEGPSLEFDSAGRSGLLWLTPRAPATTIRLVCLGVELADLPKSLPLVQVAAVVRDDRLRTNLSQTAVVQDARLKGALALVTEQARALLRRSIAEAAELAPEVGSLLAASGGDGFDALEHWMHWDGMLAALIDALSSEPSDERARKVRRLATVVAALRQACVARKDDLFGEKKGLSDELWKAPVLFDVAGAPLSPRDLESLRRALGHVPYSDRGRPFPVANGTAAWAPTSLDLRFLEELYGPQARSVLRGWGEDRVDAVRILAGKLTVEALFSFGSAKGFIGLAYAPRAAGARVRWLLKGRPPALWQPDEGLLRLDAVVEQPGLEAAPKDGEPLAKACAEALEAAAPALYEGLARLYRPQEATPAQAALREHLLDFLAWDWDPKQRAPKRFAWLALLPLLRTADGRFLSLAELRAEAENGRQPVLTSPPHPPEHAQVARGRPERVRELLGESAWVQEIRAVRPRGKGGLDGEVAAASAAAKPASAVPAAPAGPDPGPRLEAVRARLRRLKSAADGVVGEGLLDELALKARGGAPPVWRTSAGWYLNSADPLVARLFALADAEAAETYLASLVLSAVNRASARVSDADDIDLQLALARFAVSDRSIR